MRRGYRRNSFSRSGTVYGSGGINYKIRRHSFKDKTTIAKNKCRIFPLLAYTNTTPTATTINNYDGTTSNNYGTPYVQEGSRVNRIKLDILIQPSEVDGKDYIVDFYTARIMTSFHDIKSKEIRGLNVTTNDIPYWDDDTRDTTSAATVPSGSSMDSPGPELGFTKEVYDASVTIKHWWRGLHKTVLSAGQPATYVRTEFVPKKCKRSNRGMFYGIVYMNDSNITIDVEQQITFYETPLVQ